MGYTIQPMAGTVTLHCSHIRCSNNFVFVGLSVTEARGAAVAWGSVPHYAVDFCPTHAHPFRLMEINKEIEEVVILVGAD